LYYYSAGQAEQAPWFGAVEVRASEVGWDREQTRKGEQACFSRDLGAVISAVKRLRGAASWAG